MKKGFNIQGLALSASLLALAACSGQKQDAETSSANWFKGTVAMDQDGAKVIGRNGLLVEEIVRERCEKLYVDREISGKSNCAITVLLDDEKGNVAEYFTLAAQCDTFKTWAPLDPFNGTVNCQLTIDMDKTIRRKPSVVPAGATL